MLLDYISAALVTMLVTLDPPALAPIFVSLTRGMNAAERRRVAVRASLIAFGILAFFGLGGEVLLRLLGVGIPAFRISGGLLLFWIAFEMVFERRNDRKEKSADAAVTKDHIHDIAAFPLAIPLIAGPGAISATVLLSGGYEGVEGKAALIGIILVCVALTFLVFVLAERVDRFLGHTGRSILTRLLGVILAALAVQFVADGIKALVAA